MEQLEQMDKRDQERSREGGFETVRRWKLGEDVTHEKGCGRCDIGL